MNDDKQAMDLLQQINSKLDSLDGKVDQIHRDATKAGAVAGGVAGAVSGGLVATGLAFIKAQLGL